MCAEDEVRLTPFEDDKCKSAENTGFEARSDSTPMAIPSQKSPRRVALYQIVLHMFTNLYMSYINPSTKLSLGPPPFRAREAKRTKLKRISMCLYLK